jgi:hypothetical protein
LTRIAIFDGKIDQAKKYINEANSEFGKAKNDETVFTKVEADLTSARNPNVKPKDNSSAPNTTGTAASSDQMKKPIAWLPVDGSVAIVEDYSGNPEKSAAVADANNSLKNGDHKAALEKLKLADVDVAVTVAVVPLQKTLDEVHQAADLINGGKYYEGSQLVRRIQNGERFDIADASGLPKDFSKNASTSGTVTTSNPGSASDSTAFPKHLESLLACDPCCFSAKLGSWTDRAPILNGRGKA